jgi:uncharacterized protein YjiS (DUF1127 family)
MSTQHASRPIQPEPGWISLRAEQPFLLSPDAIAAVAKSASAAAVHGGLFDWLPRVFKIVQVWRDRAYSRRELADCDPRLLRDMGVSPYDAGREIDKPFWRA